MSTREILYSIIDDLSEEQMKGLIMLLKGYKDKNDPFYSESNMKALDESISQIKSGRTVTRTIEELNAMENE